MNKNNVKIIIIVVCLLGAGVLIMWQTGVIGGGSSATANAPIGDAQTDPETIAGTTEEGQPPAAGALYKDPN